MLTLSISWQLEVLQLFLISGRPDGFLGQNGKSTRGRRRTWLGDFGVRQSGMGLEFKVRGGD